MIVRHLTIASMLSISIGCGQFTDKDKNEKKEESPQTTPQPVPEEEPEEEPAEEPEEEPEEQPEEPAPEKPGIPGIPDIPGMPKIPLPPFPLPPGIPFPPKDSQDPRPPSTPSPPTEAIFQELADKINESRTARGLSPVKVEPGLNCAAKRHANDIGVKKMCGHNGSDGSSPWDRAKACNTKADGEIVACGQGSPKSAVFAWELSPGHKAIMHDPNQTVVGVAMLNNYWVAIFR